MVRIKEHNVDDLFINRWSPRAMSGEEMPDEDLMTLFEAARWAPSSFNGQPWRFLYAKRNSEYWDLFFNLLDDWNKSWCKNASVLILLISKNNFEHNDKPDYHASFGAGTAWENLALQASMKGLVAHGMAGLDRDRARKDLDVPDSYKVEAMIAVGKKGNIEDLPEELRKIENPSGRKELKEIIFEGKFSGKN